MNILFRGISRTGQSSSVLNHVHLLLASGDAVSGLGQMMKALAARMTHYRNRLEGCSGTLWESRYKSSVVQSDTYLLACCRYTELNAVRARMVADPVDYPWSSYQARRSGLKNDCLLDADPCFVALGDTAIERGHCYEKFVQQAVSAGEISLIRDALQRNQLTGTDRFVDEVERIIGLRIERRGPGRSARYLGK